MAQNSIPIILCGRSMAIASAVKEGLKPEVDVQHIVLSPESAITELATLLDSSSSRPTSNPRPVAVVTGSAYTEEEFLRMLDAVPEQSLAGVFWLRADMTKMAGMPPSGAGLAYGQKMTMRAKEALMKLRKEGRLGRAQAGEVVLY